MELLPGSYVLPREDVGEDTLFSFHLGAREGGGLEVEFTARLREDPSFCDLYIQVIRPKRKGVEILLVHGERPRLAYTDESGEVLFEKFPLEALTRISIQVNPPPEGWDD